MKIPQTIRNTYEDLKESYSKLKIKIDNEFKNVLPQEWHYISRLKEIESFALKIETGRYKSIDKFDDFFACTIVVENISKISEAKKIISERFKIFVQKPKNERLTHKNPESFPFDDLRLYIKWEDRKGVKPTGLNGLLFEVQVKTFLQHAWSIATHDLIYKSDEKNWAKERIAYQVKAMLEHAEVSIVEADQLSKSNSIEMKNKETEQITELIEVLKELWQPTLLPKNIKLLAININNVLQKLSLTANDLKRILIVETKENLGTKSLNLSPFAIVIQSLLNQETQKINKFLIGSKHTRLLIFIHKEVDIPDSLDNSTFKNAVTF